MIVFRDKVFDKILKKTLVSVEINKGAVRFLTESRAQNICTLFSKKRNWFLQYY